MKIAGRLQPPDKSAMLTSREATAEMAVITTQQNVIVVATLALPDASGFGRVGVSQVFRSEQAVADGQQYFQAEES